ncbi:MAG: hypothetical protein ACW980_13985 [Promethearchaeota archaeon]|jgi:sugar/nucleoside kinase (ribokinase family)
MPDESADIVILGHIAKDEIEVDGINRPSLGGAVYYGGIAGSHMGLKITIITRMMKEDFQILDIFKKNGIRFYANPSQETSGLKNIYSSSNMEFRSYKPLGFAGLFTKEEIPDLKTRFFVIGPIIAGEIDLEVLEYLKGKYPENLCLDMQGFIRFRNKSEVYYSSLTHKEKKEIISKVKILKLDQVEAEILTNQESIEVAAKELIKYGPTEVLITHEKGLSVFLSKSSYFSPWKNKNLGSRLTRSPEQSVRFSAALTSIKLEIPGPFNLPLHQVESLLKEEY